jgi:formylglycine-generating enzyme required for sulfatase activity
MASSVFAAPFVDNVTLSQDNSRKVKITYTLAGEQAIVTVDIRTNGVSIGEANLTHFAGDVNRVVQPSKDGGDIRTAYWYPDRAWSDHKVDSATAVVTAWATNAPPDYMVVNLTDGDKTYYTSVDSLPGGCGLSNDLYRTERMVFRKIPARGVTWRMGSPAGELGREDDEKPHLVTLTKDYWFGVFPVTMAQHKLVAGDNSSIAPATCFFTNLSSYATRPYQGVGYNTLTGTHIPNFRAKVGDNGFNIPTEAQWEYAARAGVGTALTTGRDLNNKQADLQLDELGRYDRNCNAPDAASSTALIREKDDSCGTSKVGIYKANRWGIYDIHGNVHDICVDGYAEYDGDMESVQDNPVTDPTGYTHIVARGGCWGWYDNNSAARCRLAERRKCEKANDHVVYYRHYGYRLCREVE